MNVANDKLSLLKARYQNEINAREKELAQLRAKLQVIEELESESESLNGSAVAAAAGKKYDHMTLTEATLDAINTIAVGTLVTTSKVKKHMLANGFQPGGKNFTISLAKTLKRLADSSRIQQKKTDEGKRLYGATEYR